MIGGELTAGRVGSNEIVALAARRAPQYHAARQIIRPQRYLVRENGQPELFSFSPNPPSSPSSPTIRGRRQLAHEREHERRVRSLHPLLRFVLHAASETNLLGQASAGSSRVASVGAIAGDATAMATSGAPPMTNPIGELSTPPSNSTTHTIAFCNSKSGGQQVRRGGG